jgi:glyoxylase-like metal-dependent hydrolase (beta-lactamase superfamily II)
MLRGNIGLFTGRGGTIGWFISPDAIVVVDAQFPDTAKICLENIGEKAPNRPIDFLINSHHHGDHTAGNGVFRPTARKIVAHARVPELMKMAADQQAKQNPSAAPPPLTLPDTPFEDRWSADIGKERVSTRYYGPAHTSGDATIHFEQTNVVHVGDLLFNRMHPFIDRAAGASISGWITVIDAINRAFSGDVIFLCGHAKPGLSVITKKEDLVMQRDYFAALLEYTRKAIKDGRSRDDFIKPTTDELPGFEDHGPLIDRVLAPAYDEVSGR